MRALLVATASVGLLLGVGFAVAWHYVWMVHGEVWVAFTTGREPTELTWSDSAGWWPVMVIAPGLGAFVGFGLGWLLQRAGWRLSRTKA
ncbi:MAG: hypothetical protein ACRDPJ_12285 [Nocardioidaceae bacterium]